jgi:acyl-homoserine lactone acylase PvdQ
MLPILNFAQNKLPNNNSVTTQKNVNKNNASLKNSLNVNNLITSEEARWDKHVAQTNIIRDEWGIPHIYGKTDADAVFGLMYAQCEENFPQIEKNYLEMLGRLTELKDATDSR